MKVKKSAIKWQGKTVKITWIDPAGFGGGPWTADEELHKAGPAHCISYGILVRADDSFLVYCGSKGRLSDGAICWGDITSIPYNNVIELELLEDESGEVEIT